MPAFKAIALTTLLLSTTAAAEDSVFNCQISETEQVELGLDNGLLTYYYSDTNHPEHAAQFPDVGVAADINIDNKVDRSDAEMPKDIYTVSIQVTDTVRAVIKMSMSPDKHAWTMGEVSNYDGNHLLSHWQCRLPPMDAYKFQQAYRAKTLSPHYTYSSNALALRN